MAGPVGSESSMNAPGRSWRPRFSPLGFWSSVPAGETRATPRHCFARRGLPRRIRVDNGTPWRSKGDRPTGLELWLAGLGVEVRANPPRRPQDNGVVERSQGTGKRWAEPHQAASAAELQSNLDAMDRRQRESYPYHGRASRLAAHPGLEHSGRSYDESQEERCWFTLGTFNGLNGSGSYDESQEERCWSLEKARDLLAGYVVPRRVDRSGMASVYNRNYYVGKTYAEQLVYVRYDPQQQLWLFQDGDGHQLNRQKASEINATNIRGLMEIERRVRSKKTGEEQLDVAISPE
jgi:transposase InsO family protein